jgi:predicted nucleic-acid-binding protein
MIGLDTNVLARYYIEDESDEEATHQHQAARRLIESGTPLMVAKTVVLELEWVMRGYYGFSTEQVATALRHLLSLPQVIIKGSRFVLIPNPSQSKRPIPN